jgi:molybdenum cofactor synthesis domain-containing protein
MPFAIHLITVSDRASAGAYPDLTGPLATQLLSAAFPDATVTHALIPDGVTSVQNAIAYACDLGARVVLTLGGTGLASRDHTVDATAQLISRDIPGVAEAIRAKGLEATPRAMFSRGVAGVIARGTLGNAAEVVVINIAGSPNAAEVACEVLIPVLPHLVNQLDDGKHEDSEPAQIEPQRALITERPLIRDLVERVVLGPQMGALVTFEGRVRDNDPEADGAVERLEYSAHPDAELTLSEILDEFSREAAHPDGEIRIAAHHRIGSLTVGDVAIIVCVSAAHRTDTFRICQDVVEQIKARVPIWKKQFTATDEGTWLGLS